MPYKKVGKNTGNSGRLNLSPDELQKLGVEVGEEVEVEAAETKEIAKAILESKDEGGFIIVSETGE